ncbi:terpene synthase family protein [Streptomyces xanthochromogenes]|uniref:terpene synthase family protein n=1 Tax=Streptomyces xanthochromogenes TaxID=67384 RepID=UPI00380B6B1D
MTTSIRSLLAHLPAGGMQLYCPLALREHPLGGKELDRAGVTWLIEQGLCSPESAYTRMNIGTLMAQGMPFLTDEAAIAVTCYAYWTFAWDDHLDTLAGDLPQVVALNAEANRVMLEPPPAPVPDKGPFLTSFRAARSMLEEALGPDGMAAFRTENAMGLGGQVWKVALRALPAPPSVGEYLRMRWYKGGLGVLAATTAPGAGYLMPQAAFYDPLVWAFTQSVLLPCALINDIGSLAKETGDGQDGINLVSALATEHHLDTATALLKAAELYERMVCLTPHLQKRLLADSRPAVVRYAAELPQWIPATVEFTATSARYLTAGTDTPVTVSASPAPLLWDPDDLTPPPYPDIAWWWHQLHT